MKIFKFAKPYLFSHIFLLAIYVLLTLLTTLISIASPYITGNFLDNLILDASIEVVIMFCVIFGTLNISSVVINYISSLLYIKVQTSMIFGLNHSMIKHVQNLSLSFINKNDSAYLAQRVNNDSSEIILFCMNILRNLIINVLLLIVPFVILFAMNWVIGLVFFAFILVYCILYFVFKKPLYNANFDYKEKQSKFFSSIYEQFSHIKLIKLNSIQNEFLGRLSTSFKGIQTSAINKQKISHLFYGSDSIVSTLAQIALFIIGGIQILRGNFTIGMFTIFSSYFNLLISAVRYFFSVSALYQQTLVAFNRHSELIAKNQESVGNIHIDNINKISLENVNFSYSDKKILNQLSIRFEKGHIYGIAGHNGSGKSTLVNLLMGMYIDEKEGVISYNDTDINNINMTHARKHLISFAEQEPRLVNGTIRYNISFNEDNINLTLFEKYIDILNMDDFINKSLIDSYTINDGNTNTSGGEKQKISILRTLYHDTPVMIFDEPTSALDIQSSQKFIDYLNTIKTNKIIIIVTHDEQIINKCTKVIHLDS